jgi:DNA polymerase-3 subunit epsilon
VREIVFDTETTGLDCLNGDRVIEIGCVELLNCIPTGRTFHAYINPRRPISTEAVLVHGLTDEFLRDHPCFEEIVDAFSDFLADSRLVAHNASFDRGFINLELRLCGRPVIDEHRFVDTLLLARRRHPNGPNSLDALCARYAIDNSARTTHGALLDAQILAEVYLELLGGRQATLSLGSLSESASWGPELRAVATRPFPLPPRLTAADEYAHGAFVAELGPTALWSRYRMSGESSQAA